MKRFFPSFFHVLVISRYKDDIEREEQRIISALEAELSQVKKDVEEAEKMELSISAGEKQIVQDLTESDETVQHIENEIELLTQKIKEANLQSLSIAPADDLKILLEGIFPFSLGVFF